MPQIPAADVQPNLRGRFFAYFACTNWNEFRCNMKYIYLGDRFTDPGLKGQACQAVLRSDGKCIRGKNGNMLVRFINGPVVNVVARQLRKIKGAQ